MYRTIGITCLTALIISGFCQASDSLMSVREYRTRTYELLNCDTLGPSNLDTAVARKFVVDAAIRAYSDLGDARTKKVAVTAGVSGIFVDQGLIWIAAAVLDSNKTFFPMQQVDVVQLREKTYYSSVTGIQVRPRYFIRHGDSISIYPRPQAKDTISVYYYARGKFPTDTQNVVIPAEYRFAVIYAAASLCELRRGNFDRVQLYEQLYDKEILRLRTRFEMEGLREK